MERICYRGINECAEALGITKHTLIRLMKNDPTFPVIRTGPRNCLSLFPVKQIEEWMATRVGNRIVVNPAFDVEGAPEPEEVEA